MHYIYYSHNKTHVDKVRLGYCCTYTQINLHSVILLSLQEVLNLHNCPRYDYLCLSKIF